MNEADLRRALKIARAAAVEAGEKLVPHFGKVEVEAKVVPEAARGNDAVSAVVTVLDRQTEDLLAERLGVFDSAVGFRGEEFGVRTEKDITWLVDPIDGTSHFIRGLPFCTTMIALIEDGQVVLSVIHDFIRGETYWATKGSGAYKNEERIHVSNRALRQSLISFETRLEIPADNDLYLRLRKQTNFIHTINCGFEFAMVASGKLDGRLAKDPYGMDWDFAPGSLLVSEAGGVVTNIGTDTYDYKNHDYIATNAVIYKQLTKGEEAVFKS